MKNLKNKKNVLYSTDPNVIQTEEQGDKKWDTNWENAERLLFNIGNTALPATKPTTFDDMNINFRALNLKLAAIRKTVTTWDTYNIGDTADTIDEFYNKINLIPLNSSLVVNVTDSLIWNNISVKSGDIIYRDLNGKFHHVPSQSGGYFFPESLTRENENQNNYKINYKYTTDPASSVKAGPFEIKWTAGNAETACYYNRTEILQPDATLTITIQENFMPRIYCYLKITEGQWENCYLGESFKIINNSITIKNSTKHEMKVNVR